MNAEQRSERARAAANARWSRVPDRRAAAAPLWSASPTGLDYWRTRADPDGTMDPADREACAVTMRQDYQRRLAHASALRRSQRPRES